MISYSFAFPCHYSLHFLLSEAYYKLSVWHEVSAINSVLWQQQTQHILDSWGHKTREKMSLNLSLLLFKICFSCCETWLNPQR